VRFLNGAKFLNFGFRLESGLVSPGAEKVLIELFPQGAQVRFLNEASEVGPETDRFLLQIDRHRASIVDTVEKKLKRAVWLGPECDLGAKK